MKNKLIEEGYMVVRGPSEARAEMVKLACADKLASEYRVKNAEGLVPTMLPPYEDERFRQFLHFAHGVLLGSGFRDVVYWSGRVINKAPHEAVRTWHADWFDWRIPQAYGEEPPQIGVMWYMQHTTAENGALRVIPKGHRNPARVKAVFTNEGQGVQADEVTVEAGPSQFVVIDARIPHATHANQTDQDRTMITLWFIPNYSSLPRALQEHVYRTTEYREDGLSASLEGHMLHEDYKVACERDDICVDAEGI